MTQVRGYNLWAFTGADSTQPEYRGKPVQPDRWYVGHAPGGKIESGPHESERSALWNAQQMTYTGGT